MAYTKLELLQVMFFLHGWVLPVAVQVIWPDLSSCGQYLHFLEVHLLRITLGGLLTKVSEVDVCRVGLVGWCRSVVDSVFGINLF